MYLNFRAVILHTKIAHMSMYLQCHPWYIFLGKQINGE